MKLSLSSPGRRQASAVPVWIEVIPRMASLQMLSAAIVMASLLNSGEGLSSWKTASLATFNDSCTSSPVLSRSGLVLSRVVSQLSGTEVQFCTGVTLQVSSLTSGAVASVSLLGNTASVWFVGDADNDFLVATIQANYTCVATVCKYTTNMTVALYAKSAAGQLQIWQKLDNYSPIQRDDGTVFGFVSLSPDTLVMAVFCITCGPAGAVGLALHVREIATELFSKEPLQRIPINTLSNTNRVLVDDIFTCTNSSCLLVPVDVQRLAWYVRADPQNSSSPYILKHSFLRPEHLPTDFGFRFASVGWDPQVPNVARLLATVGVPTQPEAGQTVFVYTDTDVADGLWNNWTLSQYKQRTGAGDFALNAQWLAPGAARDTAAVANISTASSRQDLIPTLLVQWSSVPYSGNASQVYCEILALPFTEHGKPGDDLLHVQTLTAQPIAGQQGMHRSQTVLPPAVASGGATFVLSTSAYSVVNTSGSVRPQYMFQTEFVVLLPSSGPTVDTAGVDAVAAAVFGVFGMVSFSVLALIVRQWRELRMRFQRQHAAKESGWVVLPSTPRSQATVRTWA